MDLMEETWEAVPTYTQSEVRACRPRGG